MVESQEGGFITPVPRRSESTGGQLPDPSPTPRPVTPPKGRPLLTPDVEDPKPGKRRTPVLQRPGDKSGDDPDIGRHGVDDGHSPGTVGGDREVELGTDSRGRHQGVHPAPFRPTPVSGTPEPVADPWGTRGDQQRGTWFRLAHDPPQDYPSFRTKGLPRGRAVVVVLTLSFVGVRSQRTGVRGPEGR